MSPNLKNFVHMNNMKLVFIPHSTNKNVKTNRPMHKRPAAADLDFERDIDTQEIKVDDVKLKTKIGSKKNSMKP